MSDILVIGGGIIGLLTARELAEAGAEVTLVEMGATGRESSWAGGGILSPLYPWRCGNSLTALASWSQRVYPDLCDVLRQETGVDPELVRSGLLTLDPEDQDQALAWAGAHGTDMQVLTTEDTAAKEPELGIRADAGLLMPDVAQVRNPRLARALHRSLEPRIELREQEEVVEVHVEDTHVVGARTRQGEIRADRVVVCTGAWTAKLLARLGPPPNIRPVRGQMILFYAKPGQINQIVLYRDRYVIPRKDGRILIGSTLEHTGFDKATTAEAKEALYRAAVEMFPLLKRTPIENHWAGLRPGSPNGVPYIGTHPEVQGLYFSAGHFRNGVVTGPASARLAADLILGREPIIDPAPYALNAER